MYLPMVMSQGGEMHAEKERKTAVPVVVPETAVIRLSCVYQKNTPSGLLLMKLT